MQYYSTRQGQCASLLSSLAFAVALRWPMGVSGLANHCAALRHHTTYHTHAFRAINDQRSFKQKYLPLLLPEGFANHGGERIFASKAVLSIVLYGHLPRLSIVRLLSFSELFFELFSSTNTTLVSLSL